MIYKKIIFGGMILAQLSVPAFMGLSFERVLRYGEVYKFRTRPADPYDLFRGRYLAVVPQPDSAVTSSKEGFDVGQKAYLVLQSDSQGFAKIIDVRHRPPKDQNYIRVRVWWHDRNKSMVHFQLPFNRYYMNERKAPRADRLYQRFRRLNSKKDVYLVVRVLNGTALIEGVYVDDKPIEHYLR